MYRELTVIAVLAALVGVALLRGRVKRYAGADGGPSSRFPRIELLVAKACAAVFVALTLTGYYDLMLHNRTMHGWILLAHVGFGGAFAAILVVLSLLRAEANAPGAISAVPYSGLRKASFWVFVASGLVLILTASLAMIPWLGTVGQHQVVVFHRVAAVTGLVSGIFYAGLAAKHRTPSVAQPEAKRPVLAGSAGGK